MAKSTIDILNIISKHGLPAAVKAIVRVYENAPQDNPHSAFWAPFIQHDGHSVMTVKVMLDLNRSLSLILASSVLFRV